jgi:hypothetical protein
MKGGEIMAKIDKSKVSRQSRLRKVLSGMGKHFQNITTLTIAQVDYAAADLEARIQKDIEASDATEQSKAAWQAQVQLERNGSKQVDPLLRGIKQFVLLHWGDSKEASSTLEDFGYAPRKPRTVKPNTQVTAAAKAIATRVARHTVGPKKRLQIKGTVPVPTAHSAAAPAAPATEAATPAAPAAAQSPSGTVTTPRGT